MISTTMIAVMIAVSTNVTENATPAAAPADRASSEMSDRERVNISEIYHIYYGCLFHNVNT